MLRDSIGPGWAVAVEVGVAVVLAGAARRSCRCRVLRLTRLAARHRGRSRCGRSPRSRLVWALCAALGAAGGRGQPVASSSAAGLRVRPGRPGARRASQDQQTFAGRARRDATRYAHHARRRPADRAARQGRHRRLRRELRPGRRAGLDVLAAGRRRARRRHGAARRRPGSPRAARSSPRRRSAASAGWRTRRCSPGCGSTTSSGTTSWSPSNRFTLSDAFKRAGWRTVGDVPSDTADVAGGHVVLPLRPRSTTRSNVGYAGPKFSYASHAGPVHAGRLPAHSSCRPTAPAGDGRDRPRLLAHAVDAAAARWSPWDQVGDGSVYDGMPAQGQKPGRSSGATPAQVQAVYGQSVQYSLAA